MNIADIASAHIIGEGSVDLVVARQILNLRIDSEFFLVINEELGKRLIEPVVVSEVEHGDVAHVCLGGGVVVGQEVEVVGGLNQ